MSLIPGAFGSTESLFPNCLLLAAVLVNIPWRRIGAKKR
jgi:hypothetical protein